MGKWRSVGINCEGYGSHGRGVGSQEEMGRERVAWRLYWGVKVGGEE